MPSTRISKEDHKLLHRLGKETGKKLQDVLSIALRDYDRSLTLDSINEGFARLRRDPVAWQEELDERALWDGADGGGLNRD